MNDWPRCVAHLDLDAFYASVEEVLNPALKGLPVIVGMGDDINSNRGAVATASYAARKFGVHSAMSIAQARKLCPGGVYLPVRHALYTEFSQRVMKILGGFSGVLAMEQVSIDEAYLEIDLALPDPILFLQELKTAILTQEGLTASVGLATNKLVAKMASGHQKPAGLTVVLPDQEEDFLAPLPVGKLHGVGPKTAQHLEQIGIHTIGDLAAADSELLQEKFGPNLGLELHQHAAGLDTRPLVTDYETKSLSSETTFSHDMTDRRELWRQLQEMAQNLEQRMESRGLLARTISIKLRLSNWQTLTRSETLPAPTRTNRDLQMVAARLMRLHYRRGTALRLIGLRVSNFVEDSAPRQLMLPHLD